MVSLFNSGSPLTTLEPRLMMAPISSQPALVLSLLIRLFWLADLSSSSPTLKMILPLVWGMPLGVALTAPRRAARAPLYPLTASWDQGWD